MKWVLLLVSNEKTGAENKKQHAQGYTVTLPIESAGNPWKLHTGFSQNVNYLNLGFPPYISKKEMTLALYPLC